MSDSILVAGSVAFDTILDFPDTFARHILPDKIHILNVSFVANRMSRNYGGTGGNIAYNLALLGLKPLLFATVGRDFAPGYRDWLLERGVDLRGVKIFEEEYTAAATIITDQNDNQITAFHGGAMFLNDIEGGEHVRPGRAALAIVSPDGKGGMHRRANELRSAGVPFVMDPGQSLPAHSPEELRTLIQGARALVVNDYELQLVLDKLKVKESDLLALTPTVIITLGHEGSRALDRTAGEIRVGVAETQSLVDPTGAGDAYRAGLLLGMIRGLALDACLKLGAVAGVYAVEKYGTQNHSHTPAEFKKRYEANFGSWPLA